MRILFPAGLFLTLCLLISKPAFAQPDSVSNRLWVVKFSPQHLLIHGYNLEVERRFSANGKRSFTFSPRYYNGNTKTIDKFSGRESGGLPTKVTGLGFEAMYRVYRPHLTKPGKQQYVAYGINYHRFALDYSVLGWGEVTESNGLSYYKYQWHPRQDEVNRLGAVLMFGAQNPIITKRLLADFYGGIGYRSGQNKNPESDRYQTNILDYGSSGVYLTVGFKLGYSF